MPVEDEVYFGKLSKQYSQYPPQSDAIGIFNHLSLVIQNNVSVGEIAKYLDLLKTLKTYLPVKLKVDDVIICDDLHLTLKFDTKQTEEIRKLAEKFIPDGVVTTFYTKVVWFVPKAKQSQVIEILKKTKEMTFFDFILVANRQEDASTIYSSNRFN